MFASVEEDEIGAVFDQVLKTGPHPVQKNQDESGATSCLATTTTTTV